MPSTTSHPLTYYRMLVEELILKSFASLGERTKLRDACEYALTNGGKRLRPLMVLFVAEALGHGLDVSCAALSVEFFHTASLIADDLPCMDNDDERRNKPSAHRVFGESVALLASYALITAAFEKIYENSEVMKRAGTEFSPLADEACVLALKSASRCSGIQGATGGQFLDLFPPKQDLEMITEVIYKKTITLFEVCFTFGWVFGGGDLSLLEEVKKAAWHFGMAFQIADDLADMAQDEKNQRPINMARLLGKGQTLELFSKEASLFKEALQSLNIWTPSFEEMYLMLLDHAAKASA